MRHEQLRQMLDARTEETLRRKAALPDPPPPSALSEEVRCKALATLRTRTTASLEPRSKICQLHPFQRYGFSSEEKHSLTQAQEMLGVLEAPRPLARRESLRTKPLTCS